MMSQQAPFAPRVGLGLQSLLLAGSTAIAQCGTAVLFIFTARSSHVEDFGLAVTVIALATACAGIADFGGQNLWVREMVRGEISADLLGRMIAGKLAVAVILGGSLLVATKFSSLGSMTIAGVILAICTLLGFMFQVSLRATGRVEWVAAAVLCDRGFAMLIFFTCRNVVPDHVLLLTALSAGGLLGAFLMYACTPLEVRPRLHLKPRVNPWGGSLYFGLSGLAVSAQGLDTPLLAAASSASAAGVYGSVNRWTQPLGLLANAYARAASPYLASARSTRAALRSTRSSVWLPAVAMIFSLAIAASAPWLVHLLLGDRYMSAAPVLSVLAIATVPGIANQVLAVALQARGRDRMVSGVLAGAVSLQLLLVALISPKFGAMGAALGFAILQVIVFAVLSAVLWKQQRVEGVA
jgi:O-antigen/teichoic acid export membrane protein